MTSSLTVSSRAVWPLSTARWVEKKCDRTDIKVYYIPATRIAREQHLGTLANVIMLGQMFAKCSVASLETVKKAIEKCVPASKAQLIETNMKAITLGGSF